MDDKLPPVRLGLVGLGGHGRTIGNAAAASDRVEVVGVFDVDGNLATEAAERFSCPATDSLEELLGIEGMEAVALVTPNRLHQIQAEAAFKHGLHVFVEKPIANTAAEGLAIIAAAERANRKLMIGHNMRFGRAVQMARRALDEGKIGHPVSVEVHFSADNTRRLDPSAWRLQPDQCPLLPVMQLGIHGLDLVQFFLGQIEEVHAFSRSVTTRPGVVDSVVAALRLESGVTGTLVSNYCSQILFEYRIAGTEGTIHGTPHRYWYRANASTDGRGDGEAEEKDFTAYDSESYQTQLDVFAQAIREGTDLHPDGLDGLRALAVVEALQQSSETGAPSFVRSFETEHLP